MSDRPISLQLLLQGLVLKYKKPLLRQESTNPEAVTQKSMRQKKQGGKLILGQEALQYIPKKSHQTSRQMDEELMEIQDG